MSWNLMVKSRGDNEVVGVDEFRKLIVGMQNSKAGPLYLWYWDDMVSAESIPTSFNVMSG